MRIQVRLPRVETDQYEMPETCPHGCGGRYFQPHGRQGLRKQVRDTQVSDVLVYRYRCVNCGRTFRVYPKGVLKGAQQSARELAC